MQRKRLIVNADDFGLTDGVNRAIVDGHRRGIVTSATLMATGRAFASAVASAVENPTLGVGVHLNLVEGRPVSQPDRVASLVGPGGTFAHAPGALVARLAAGGVRIADVEAEIRAQIERVLAAGVRPTHLDGHKHAHLAPRVFAVVARLAREYGIRGVRCAPSVSAPFSAVAAAPGASRATVAKQRFTARALSALAARCRRHAEAAGLRTPARLLGVTETGFLSVGLLDRLFGAAGAWPAELMCHPGYLDSDLSEQPTRLTASRERELDALTSPETVRAVEREGIELINYADLGEEP